MVESGKEKGRSPTGRKLRKREQVCADRRRLLPKAGESIKRRGKNGRKRRGKKKKVRALL